MAFLHRSISWTYIPGETKPMIGCREDCTGGGTDMGVPLCKNPMDPGPGPGVPATHLGLLSSLWLQVTWITSSLVLVKESWSTIRGRLNRSPDLELLLCSIFCVDRVKEELTGFRCWSEGGPPLWRELLQMVEGCGPTSGCLHLPHMTFPGGSLHSRPWVPGTPLPPRSNELLHKHSSFALRWDRSKVHDLHLFLEFLKGTTFQVSTVITCWFHILYWLIPFPISLHHSPPGVSWDQLSNRLSVLESLGLLGGSDGKEAACNAGDRVSIPRSGRYPGEGNVKPLQYSCLENR